jgi:hypothetical protein
MSRPIWTCPVFHLPLWLLSVALLALGLSACQVKPSDDSDPPALGVSQQPATSNANINGTHNGSYNGSLNGSINGSLNGALNGLNGSLNSALNGAFNALNGSYNGALNGALNGSPINNPAYNGSLGEWVSRVAAEAWKPCPQEPAGPEEGAPAAPAGAGDVAVASRAAVPLRHPSARYSSRSALSRGDGSAACSRHFSADGRWSVHATRTHEPMESFVSPTCCISVMGGLDHA